MIVVTAASGQYGRLAIGHLMRRGVPASQIVAAVRAPERVADLAAVGVVVREADYDRPETLGPALAGADRVLFVSGNGPDEVRIGQHRAVVEALAAARVGLVAYTSVVGAPVNPISVGRVHRDTEGALAAAGVPTVLLRNAWYTENHTFALPAAVAGGVIVGCAGQGRIASATRSDLAEAAAVVLTSPQVPVGRVFELAGPVAWSLPELADLVSRRCGHPVVYRDLAPEEYAQVLLGLGLPGFVIDLVVDADTQIARGALEGVGGELESLLGRPATDLGAAVAAALGQS